MWTGVRDSALGPNGPTYYLAEHHLRPERERDQHQLIQLRGNVAACSRGDYPSALAARRLHTCTALPDSHGLIRRGSGVPRTRGGYRGRDQFALVPPARLSLAEPETRQQLVAENEPKHVAHGMRRDAELDGAALHYLLIRAHELPNVTVTELRDQVGLAVGDCSCLLENPGGFDHRPIVDVRPLRDAFLEIGKRAHRR